jgi:hypothetical protein
MKFSYKQTFPKDIATVLRMFCDPAYHEKLQKALGAMDLKQLEHSDDGNRFRIKLGYTVKSSVPLPGFAKKVLGETSAVVQEESWDRAKKTGELSVMVKTLPGTLRCTTSLSEASGTTTKTFNWDVSVRIPLIGGKIEQLVVDDIKTKIEPEQATGRKLLQDY